MRVANGCPARQRGAPRFRRQLRVGETLSSSLPYVRPGPFKPTQHLPTLIGPERTAAGLIEGVPYAIGFSQT